MDRPDAVSSIERSTGGGAVAVGVGGWLTSHDDLAAVGERAAAIVDACRAQFGLLV